MRNLVIGCLVAAVAALSVKTEARPPASFERMARGQTVRLGRSQLGLASWYGEEFQGNPTASGELFDMNGFTAAHPSLPLGSRIKVTNLRNHRSLVLRVNDRGPHVPGRLLDISKAAAQRLGFLGSGTAKVRLRTISYPKGYSARRNFEALASCASLVRYDQPLSIKIRP